VQFWENGGVTSVTNGVPACFGHHYLMHEGGWTLVYDPDTGVTTLIGPKRQRLVERARWNGSSIAAA
jgi:hypothetical protein